MRFILVATSLLGLAAAAPGACRPKSKTSSLGSAGNSTTSTSTSSLVSTVVSAPTTTVVPTTAAVPTSSSASSSAAAPTTTKTSTSAPTARWTTSTAPTSVATTATSKSSSVTTSSSASVVTTTTTQSSSATSSLTTTTKVTTTSSASTSTVITTTTKPATTTSTASTSSLTPTTTAKPTSTTLTTSTKTTSVPTTTAFTSTTSTTSSTTSNPATASVTNAVALTWYDSNLNNGQPTRSPPSGGYTCFSGPSINFPAMSSWASFENMWTLLKHDALEAKHDTPDQVQQIRSAILDVSQKALVDPRVILAVVVLESTGNPYVECTTNGVPNCGLMQAYNSSSYNPNDSANSIHLMIQDGTQGTVYGPGLVQLLNGSPLSRGSVDGNIYKALRAYNSGKINDANLSDGQGAPADYVSNMANYLQGWNGYGDGPKNCDFTKPFNTMPSS